VRERIFHFDFPKCDHFSSRAKEGMKRKRKKRKKRMKKRKKRMMKRMKRKKRKKRMKEKRETKKEDRWKNTTVVRETESVSLDLKR